MVAQNRSDRQVDFPAVPVDGYDYLFVGVGLNGVPDIIPPPEFLSVNGEYLVSGLEPGRHGGAVGEDLTDLSCEHRETGHETNTQQDHGKYHVEGRPGDNYCHSRPYRFVGKRPVTVFFLNLVL